MNHKSNAPRTLIGDLNNQRGITFVECLIGALVLLIGSVAFLMSMQQTMAHTDYMAQMQVALNTAEGRLEELASTDFDTLLNGTAFTEARASSRSEPLSDLPGGVVAVQVRPTATAGTLDLHVAVCWTVHGHPVGDPNCRDGPDADIWVNSR